MGEEGGWAEDGGRKRGRKGQRGIFEIFIGRKIAGDETSNTRQFQKESKNVFMGFIINYLSNFPILFSV